ncbi:MAG TPA: YciI family protein [Gemmatimonadaceae bacterium]|nr:YciI family protein [Gemmatimonadaceae bacterium]
MVRTRTLRLLSLAAALTVTFTLHAQQPPATPAPPDPAKSAGSPETVTKMTMITYQAVFISKGPRWTAASTPESKAAHLASREHVGALMAAGKVAIAGPFDGDGALRGLLIAPGSPEDARSLADALPGVADGRYVVEVLKWMGPEGWFQKPADLSQMETIYFGFLVDGPDRTQDKVTAQALQRGHLDYMGGQAKIGKLVLAGPLLDGGRRRGLIAYRVPTLAEALERASADPMIKAGRLAPELYEWTIPKGTLK